jgi:hypothetical protein
VQIFIVPTEALARLGPVYARMVGRLVAATVAPAPAGALLKVLTNGLGWAPEVLAEAEARRAVQKGIEGHELLKTEGLYTVPAGAIGWARLSWKSQPGGPSAFTAKLWADKKGAVSMPLQVVAAFHQPLRVQPQLVLPSLRDEDLQGAGHTAEIVCWSSTRPRFELKAEMMKLGGRANAAANPFHVGRPRPLNRAELAQLQARNNAGTNHSVRGRVLSGYRVPITLKSVAADGKTPSPLGPFRRWVRLTSDDEEVEPVQVEVVGRVQGVLQVGGEGDEGLVSFDQPFPRTRGASTSINLFSSVPGLTLTVDEEQTTTAARFLRVTLGPPKAEGDGRRSWTLKVTVPPNEARGNFPRPEDPEYEDSAIYLKAREKGKPERRVRIPVRGTALEG